MISLNWVKDYVDIENEDLNELAVKIDDLMYSFLSTLRMTH